MYSKTRSEFGFKDKVHSGQSERRDQEMENGLEFVGHLVS